MDKLEAELEGYKSVRLRQGTSARRLSERGEITPHYSRKYHGNEGKRWSVDSIGSTASTSLDAARQRTAFVWQMPFTVKCIGTFRYYVCVSVSVCVCGCAPCSISVICSNILVCDAYTSF